MTAPQDHTLPVDQELENTSTPDIQNVLDSIGATLNNQGTWKGLGLRHQIRFSARLNLRDVERGMNIVRSGQLEVNCGRVDDVVYQTGTHKELIQ